MIDDPLAAVLLLLAAAVLVVAFARRVGLPAILGYLAVGALLGPHALGLTSGSDTTRLLAELGVVFLLFTLGLEFSWPRMVALRREVFGVGTAQMALTASVGAAAFTLFEVPLLASIALGGAVAVSSTAIVVQQLTEQAEINRTHGRMAFSVLLFQDLAFVPFLVLAGALAAGSTAFTVSGIVAAVGAGVLALAVVLLAGRYALRPLLYEIAHSRLRELFTLAVLLVALGSAWVSHLAGISMATGAFLAGVMLAETEYRHQVEAVIRPFRDILLGLFFISVGMLLDLRVLYDEWVLVLAILFAMTLIKALLMAGVGLAFGLPRFKAVRTGLVLSVAGEFGVAILTILIQGNVVDQTLTQPLLVAIVLSMVSAPLLLRHNRAIARVLLRERRKEPVPAVASASEDPLLQGIATREHVLLCGFGRVGQNLARVLESQGIEFLAMDLDPARVRAARQAGLPALYGDAADEELLQRVGVDAASAVVVTFSDPDVALGIVRAIRRFSADLPILVRTQDDTRLEELRAAGATEVVPETFEASLMLASHALLALKTPVSRVVRTIGSMRSDRYQSLRGLVRGELELPQLDDPELSEELASVVLPPGAAGIGKQIETLVPTLGAVRIDRVVRRDRVLRAPCDDVRLEQGDQVVLCGRPEALAHAEQVLLAG
ncbi:MAG: potassium transporter [Sinobacteraceae bacterium]|nr:potassium transporter [Nevskiaceae bacterium]